MITIMTLTNPIFIFIRNRNPICHFELFTLLINSSLIPLKYKIHLDNNIVSNSLKKYQINKLLLKKGLFHKILDIQINVLNMNLRGDKPYFIGNVVVVQINCTLHYG